MKNDIKNNSDNVTKNYNISQINKKKSEFNTDLINNHITKFSEIDQNNENIVKEINNNSNRINNLSDKLNKCWNHIAPFSRLYLVKIKVVVQLKSQQ